MSLYSVTKIPQNKYQISYTYLSITSMYLSIFNYFYQMNLDENKQYPVFFNHAIFQTDTIEKSAKAVGMSIPPSVTTESGALKSILKCLTKIIIQKNKIN